MKKILLVRSQHGNEILGDKLLAHLQHRHPHIMPCIDEILANPRAHANHQRFIETDMNRSHVPHPKTYEEHLAQGVLKHIKSKDYDLVLDLHTTTCIQPPCILVRGISEHNLPFLSATKINRIVLMRHPIVETSLIGNCSKAMSIEVNRDNVSAELLDGLCEDILLYLDGKSRGGTKKVFEVQELLLKEAILQTNIASLQNFKKSPQGFYPVLVGENSYKKDTKYLGFKASKLRRIKL